MPSAKQVAATGGVSGLVAVALGLAVPNIKELEGRRNVPYYDIVKVLTVCDGHTGKDIVVRKVYTDKECDDLTLKDTQKYINGVLAVNPQLAYHPVQLASVVSLSYNIGVSAYQKSTVAVLFNRGDFLGGCNFILKYNKAGGKVVHGLVLRREKEKALCLSTLTPQGVNDVNLG